MPFNGAYDDTKAANRVVLVGGLADVGFATVTTSNPGNVGNVTLNAGPNFIGLVSAVAYGNVADNAANSGNPVLVGGVYYSTATTYDSGDRTTVQADANGNIKTTEATLLAGEDLTNNVIKVEQRNVYSFVSQASIQVKSGANFVHGLLISSISTPSLTVADSITATTPIIATFPAGVPVGFYPLNSTVNTGLTLSMSPGALPQITVVTRT